MGSQKKFLKNTKQFQIKNNDFMKIANIIQLNDWESKKFLRMIIAIQIAMIGIVGLDYLGLEIPILRQVIGFFYLTFVPGIIILRLLKIHRLGDAETILLSSGLSISFLMFSGFFLNTILSFFNIDSPLSFRNIFIFITAITAFLSIISFRIGEFYHHEIPPLKISRSAIYLMLLPVLSIVGTYSVNFHNNNIVLMILIVLIALIPVLVAFNKIPSELYPLAIAVIAISLLFHRSLISMYLTGWDINSEYYFYRLVIDNAYWNLEIMNNLNAMLSIVILPAVYSYFLKIDGAWVFKIVYPIIFSLVPLGLYCVYQRQIKSNKMAFFSVFFFMSFLTFFTEMLSLARQEIAELFFVLLLFLMVQDTINKNIRNALLLIFSMSLATSHYGLSYIYIILIIFIYFFSLDMVRTLKLKWLTLPEFNLKKLTLKYYMVFYIIFVLLWYINVSNSSAFKSIVNIGYQIFNSISTEFFNLENRDENVLMALGIIDPAVPSLGREIYRSLQFLTQFFIITGFLKIIIYREFSKLKAEYFYLMVASFALLLLSLLPYSAKSMNMTRIYHITLITLSPLFISGGAFIIEKINIIYKLKHDHAITILILGVLIPYFLFNTGFVYEITNDTPSSMSLGMERMKNNNLTKFGFYNTYIPEQDVYGATWYNNNKDETKTIYADRDSKLNVLASYGMSRQYKVNSLFRGNYLNIFDLQRINYYLYLRRLNVCDNSFRVSSSYAVNKSVISPLTNNSLRIYSNGCGEIYTK
jgi:uncharacterized membrane protein